MVRKSLNSRVATIDEREVLQDSRFHAALRELAREQQRDYAEVEQTARKCLDELAVRPADRYLGWIAALSQFMHTRSFEREFDVNVDALEGLKELSRTRPLVFLWSHKSHLDAFVFTRTLYDAGFRPQPLIFAGINMNFAGFGALARHSGAIFPRHSFKDDGVYKLVLRYFIDYLASQRVPLSWSIEGTRSRTGKLLPPKLGLIHWVMDAYKNASIDDALFVPVAISFDQIPEMDDYIAMQHGVPKRKESLKWFIDYIAGMKSNYGKVYVRFAEPISLSESVPVSNNPDASDNDSQGQKLAFEICNRIEHIIPITLTDLVTLVLLAANGRALDAEQIRNQAMDIVDLIERGGLPTAGDLHIRNVDELQTKLQSLTTTGLLQCYAEGATPVYLITPGRQLAAAYYRNTIVHYFLTGALAETALTSAGLDPSGQSFLSALMRLRDLLKFEFTFKSKDVFQEEAVDFLDYRYPDWRGRGSTFPPGPPPLFGQGILRSFVEAYWVLAGLLVKRGSQPISVEHESALIDVCLARGEEMLLRKEITTEAALSGPLFATAMRLARYRALLDADDGQIRIRREKFASEVEQTLVAINELQDVYDQSLQEPAIRHVHEARSIA
jgi:glycerol-3-phosphate O-acyltransferase